MATSKPHYHIRWSTKDDLDWQVFGADAEAESAAASMVQPNETFTIEEAGEHCSRCAPQAEPKPAPVQTPKARKHGLGR